MFLFYLIEWNEDLKIKFLITDVSFGRNDFPIYTNWILYNCLALNVVIADINEG